jgi:pseudouridine-5'-phosphate glycosidase
MAFTAKTVTITVDLDTATGQIRMHATGGVIHTGADWTSDPQQAWDQLAAAVGPQVIAGARRAQQPLPDDV